MDLFHTGINNVNIDVALKAKELGMKVVVFGSASESIDKKTRHSCGKTLFELADLVVDSCAPLVDASVPLKSLRQNWTSFNNGVYHSSMDDRYNSCRDFGRKRCKIIYPSIS